MFQRLIAYFFAALFFFVPLVLYPKTYEVFEFNKMMLTYIFAGIIAALWASRMISEKRFIFRRTPLDLPLLLFLASQIISTILSIDPHTSLWGYYSRFHGGLISTLTYLLLFYAFVSNLTAKDLKLILYSILSSTSLVAVYAIAEHFGIDKDLWVQDVQNRVFSTLGQPNWLSAYLLAVLPLPIFLAIRNKNRLHTTCYILLAILLLTAIWFTKSQSGIGATLITLVAIAAYLLAQKTKLVYLVLGLLITAGVIYKWDFVAKVSPFGLTNLDQLVQTDLETRHAGSDSMVIRQVVWKGAIDLFRRRPVFGTGVETFAYSYYWTRPAAHNLLSEWDFLYNKAHNEYLNFLATTGAYGLLSYLLLVLYILYVLRQSPELFFGFFSILITNYFGFSVAPVALFFFLYPALSIVSSIQPPPAKGEVSRKARRRGLTQSHPLSLGFLEYSLLTLIWILALAWAFLILRRWSADISFNHGKALADSGYVGYALPKLEEAAALYPQEPLYRNSLAESYASAALAIQQQYAALPKEEQTKVEDSYYTQRSTYIRQATESIDGVIKDNPYHLNYLKSRAKIELTLAQVDPSFLGSALMTLYKANELAPTDAKILYNIGLLQLELNQPDQAQLAFTKAIELKSDYWQAQQQLDLLK